MAGQKTKEPTTGQDDTQNVVVPLPRALHRELRFLSIDRHRPMNALIVEAVEQWMKRQPERGRYGGEEQPSAKATKR